jgi:hypothetical protein
VVAGENGRLQPLFVLLTMAAKPGVLRLQTHQLFVIGEEGLRLGTFRIVVRAAEGGRLLR